MWREVRETPFPLYRGNILVPMYNGKEAICRENHSLYRGNILVPMYNGKEAIREIHYFVEWLFSEKSDQKARTAKLAKE